MSEQDKVQAPSPAKIMAATLVAMVVVAILLVVVVLPAEYGIDPLGTGKALGLNHLASASAKPATTTTTAETPGTPGGDVASIIPVLVASLTGDAPTRKGVFIAQPGRFQTDSREITIDPHEGTEIKYHMNKGAGLVYSWTSSVPMSFEFHGEPNVKPAGAEGTDYYESYELSDQPKDQSHGTFIAPSTGVHGWFWENKGATKVTVKLVSAGYFDWVFQNRKDKESALKPMDPYSWPSHPTVPDQEIH
jgi:hypothetical protein